VRKGLVFFIFVLCLIAVCIPQSFSIVDDATQDSYKGYVLKFLNNVVGFRSGDIRISAMGYAGNISLTVHPGKRISVQFLVENASYIASYRAYFEIWDESPAIYYFDLYDAGSMAPLFDRNYYLSLAINILKRYADFTNMTYPLKFADTVKKAILLKGRCNYV